MKILLVTPVFPGSLGAYCRKAFLEMGHSVEVFDYRQEAFGIDYLSHPRRSLMQKILFRLAPPFQRTNSKLAELAASKRPDFLLVIKGELITPETVEQITQKYGIPVLLWYPDSASFLSTRAAHQNITKSLRHYTISFLADIDGIAPEIKILIRHLEFLTFGCDPSVHKTWELSQDEKAFYGSDICFIGNTHGEGSVRDQILSRLMDFDIRIWGTAWNKTEIYQRFPEKFQRSAYADELAKIYSASKIAININGNYVYLNVRNFEAPACGILTLTSDISSLSNYFQIGKEIDVYQNVDELRQKISYYLEHEQERIAIADAGQQRALKDHTIQRRLQTMLTVLSIEPESTPTITNPIEGSIHQ